MGILKTLTFASLISGLTAIEAWAGEHLLTRVTECVGRLSAEMEHRWLLSEASGDQIESVRADFIDILQALVTPDTASEAMAGRIDAKIAHSALLTQASFSKNARQSEWASKRAKSELDACREMLLSTAANTSATPIAPESRTKNLVNQKTWRTSQ